MKKDLEILLKMDIKDIIKSPEHSIKLLKIYSVLFLGGGQPRTCSKSQEKYFLELKKNGMQKVTKKHILSFEGRRYIPGLFEDGILIAGHLHIDSKYTTDAKALELLNNGLLSVKDFQVLPDGYVKKVVPVITKKEVKAEPKEVQIYSIDEIKAALKKGSYHELNKIAIVLNLSTGKLKLKKAKELIENYIVKQS